MLEASRKSESISPTASRFCLNKPLAEGFIIRMKSLGMGESSELTFSSIENPLYERNEFQRSGRAFALFAGRMQRYAELCGIDLALSNDVRILSNTETVKRMISAVRVSYIESGNFALGRVIRELFDMADSCRYPVSCVSFPEFGDENHRISKMGGFFLFQNDGSYEFVPLGRRGRVEIKGDDDAQPYFDFGGTSFLKFESDYPVDIPIGLRSYMAWKQIPLTFGGICFVADNDALRAELEEKELNGLSAISKSLGISLSCPVPREGV